jgi:hypothetical protein
MSTYDTDIVPLAYCKKPWPCECRLHARAFFAATESDRPRQTTGPDTLYSTAELKERGLRPRTGEVPARDETRRHGQKGGGYLWRLDQAVAKKMTRARKWPRESAETVAMENVPATVLRAIRSLDQAAASIAEARHCRRIGIAWLIRRRYIKRAAELPGVTAFVSVADALELLACLAVYESIAQPAPLPIQTDIPALDRRLDLAEAPAP